MPSLALLVLLLAVLLFSSSILLLLQKWKKNRSSTTRIIVAAVTEVAGFVSRPAVQVRSTSPSSMLIEKRITTHSCFFPNRGNRLVFIRNSMQPSSKGNSNLRTTGTNTNHGIPVKHVHFPTVDSTQNKCQELIKKYYEEEVEASRTSSSGTSATTPSVLWAITASEQTQGRGSNQRLWTSIQGNTFLTVAFPIDLLLPFPKIRMILPLKVGTIIASCIHDFIHQHNSNLMNNHHKQQQIATESTVISLKWPNDVLLNDCKVAGVLIESFSVSNYSNQYYYYFLIGIGVNVAHTPTVFYDGRTARPATCLADYCTNFTDDAYLSLAMNITNQMADWLYQLQSIEEGKDVKEEKEQNFIIHSWESWARPWMGKETQIRDQNNSIIIPLGIQHDGQLKVQYLNNSQVGLLPMTDYLL
jgi:biotin-(acetyl-CoA carboxylase) ligase